MLVMPVMVKLFDVPMSGRPSMTGYCRFRVRV